MHLSEKMTAEWSKLDNKMRFVRAVVEGKLKIANRKKAELVAQLQKDGYATFEPPAKKKAASAAEDDAEEAEAAEEVATSTASSARGYDYLLGMPLYALTLERVQQLEGQLAAKEAELKALLAMTPKQLWADDLVAFEAGLSEWEAELVRAEQEALGKAKGKKKGAPSKPPPKARGGKKKKAGSDTEESEDDDDVMSVDSDSDYEQKKKKKPPPKKKAAAAEKAADKPIDLSNAEVIAAPVPVAPKRKVRRHAPIANPNPNQGASPRPYR